MVGKNKKITYNRCLKYGMHCSKSLHLSAHLAATTTLCSRYYYSCYSWKNRSFWMGSVSSKDHTANGSLVGSQTQGACIVLGSYRGSGTNNAPFLLQNLKHVILSHNNITLKHTIWQFRCNVQIKTINYYTHINTLPTTLKQVLILLDPVFWILSVKKKKLKICFFLHI